MLKYAKDKGIAKTKTKFAEIIGSTQPALSDYTAGKKTPSQETLDKMNAACGGVFATDWLYYGIGDTYIGGDGTVQVGNNNTNGIPPKNFDNEQRWFGVVAEKDRQIDRLLTIIENMQRK